MNLKNLLELKQEGEVELNLKLIEDEDGYKPSILIEGTGSALKFLSDLLSEISKGDSEKSISLSPDGAGSIYFSTTSELGFYINRID